MNIRVSYEAQRGCGFRKPGGLYLISGRQVTGCCQLPIPFVVCRVCGNGIKPSRGWTWIAPRDLFALKLCTNPRSGQSCLFAARDRLPERAGLLWIGEMFYSDPSKFIAEAVRQGISRRIASIPKGFEVGKTHVFLAHQKAYGGKPGLFGYFLPEKIEYVVGPHDTAEKLERFEARGVQLVEVRPQQTEFYSEVV